MLKESDKLQTGEEYEPLVLRVTAELNKQFLRALDISHPRYDKIVHPGLLLNFSSITQSPSFHLPDDVAAVGAKFKAEFLDTPFVGQTFTFLWKVDQAYEKRSRIYQICNILIQDTNNRTIMKRRINNTFVGGEHLRKRVEWERKTGYRRAVSFSVFPEEGYEIIGKKRDLTIQKQMFFSGGLPGPTWPSRNIHTDREISIRSGIGKPIASGIMFEAYLTDLMLNFFGADWMLFGQTDLIAIDMAGDGDTVFPKAVIENQTYQTQSKEICLSLWCENQYGNNLMVGKGYFRDIRSE
jgi:hypothetical protein